MIKSSKTDLDFNAFDNRGNTGFIVSCFNGNKEIVDILLQASEFNKAINLDTTNKDGNSGFIFACQKEWTEIAHLLLDRRKTGGINFNIINKDGNSAFWFACQYGMIDIVSTMLDESYDVEVNR